MVVHIDYTRYMTLQSIYSEKVMFHNYLPVSEDAVRLTRPPTTQYVQSSEVDWNGVQKRQKTTHHLLHNADCFRPGKIFYFKE